MLVIAPIDRFDKLTRVDGYFSISDSVFKSFKFKITEPNFLTFFTNFEKKLSGGSISLSIAHAESQNNEGKVIPTYYNKMTSDAASFVHEILEPGISGDVKLNHASEYIVTVSGGHKAILTKTFKITVKFQNVPK